MFEKLKKICTFKKEKKMSPETTTGTRSTKKLREQLESQSQQISLLRTRLSQVVDDMHIIKNELNRFKTAVSDDLKQIVEKI